MKNTRKPFLYLIISGLLFLSVTLLISQYIQMSDTLLGLFTGIGIGFMLLAFVYGNRKIANQ